MWIKAQDGRLYNSNSFSSIGIKEEMDVERRTDKFGVVIVKSTGSPSKWSVQGLGAVAVTLGLFETLEIAEAALAEIASKFSALDMSRGLESN